jgi:alkanesulfonate monooxygenase SsuD/methylene tetrahydromethanopterin reductase-like flavin-dependent oxidoreductase (luciferase family)
MDMSGERERAAAPFSSARSRAVVARLGKLNPPPVRPIPILIGGSGERITLRIAACHAQIWHGSGDPATYQRKVAVLERWCREVGRDASEIERAIFINQPEVRDPDAYLALGVTRFGVLMSDIDHDTGFVREMLSWRDGRR